MKEWKWNSDGSEAICECGEDITDMKLKMTYVFGIDNLDIVPTRLSYGGREGYEMRTELICDCGRTYKEDEDYRLEWEEQDAGWEWTLGVDMEEGL